MVYLTDRILQSKRYLCVRCRAESLMRALHSLNTNLHRLSYSVSVHQCLNAAYLTDTSMFFSLISSVSLSHFSLSVWFSLQCLFLSLLSLPADCHGNRWERLRLRPEVVVMSVVLIGHFLEILVMCHIKVPDLSVLMIDFNIALLALNFELSLTLKILNITNETYTL